MSAIVCFILISILNIMNAVKAKLFSFGSLLSHKPGFTSSLPCPFQIDSRPVLKSALLGVGIFTARASTVNAASSSSASSSPTLLSTSSCRKIQTLDNDSLYKISTSDIETTLIDNRNYKAFTLTNGLRVLLISDGTVTHASAGLDVHVGSFSDPIGLPGLAHFAAHMCFLGTKKYPEEDEFSKYLSSHSGSSNAYTDSEDTVYFFDCDDTAFEGALDRFSNFFISPLFAPDAVGRELNAIDSEHSKKVVNNKERPKYLQRSDDSGRSNKRKSTNNNNLSGKTSKKQVR